MRDPVSKQANKQQQKLISKYFVIDASHSSHQETVVAPGLTMLMVLVVEEVMAIVPLFLAVLRASHVASSCFLV